MAQKTLSLFLLLAATATLSSALNITSILEQYPDFSTFNTLLTQSGVASEINGRSSITVLAVDNTILRGFEDLPPKVIKIVLSVHVVLDYYDIPKIESIGDKSTILTTLLQTTGSAQEKQGFLNMSKTGGSKDQVVFGSTMPGSVSQANLMKSVVAKPYNVSVLQVDSLIVPSVVGAPTPAPAESDSDATVADSTAPPANNAKAPSTNAPATTATAPITDAPAVIAADAPVQSKKEVKAVDTLKSGAGKVAASAGVGVAIMGSILLGL